MFLREAICSCASVLPDSLRNYSPVVACFTWRNDSRVSVEGHPTPAEFSWAEAKHSTYQRPQAEPQGPPETGPSPLWRGRVGGQHRRVHQAGEPQPLGPSTHPGQEQEAIT